MLYFSITLYARRGSMFAWWIYSKAQKHGEIQNQLDSIKGQKKHVSQQGVTMRTNKIRYYVTFLKYVFVLR